MIHKNSKASILKKPLHILVLLCFIGVAVFSVYKIKACRGRRSHESWAHLKYVICEITEIISETEVPVNYIGEPPRNYDARVKVLLPCSDDFAEGDEIEILSSQYYPGATIKVPHKLKNGDIIIIGYSGGVSKRDNINTIGGYIYYGSVDNLKNFTRHTDGKVMDLIDKISESESED